MSQESQDSQQFWKECESLVSLNTEQSSTIAPWIVKEQDFFSLYGLTVSNVKLMAGLGLLTTCLGLTMFLLYLCSRRLRGTQLETALVPRRRVITETLQPPCYEEVIEVDRDSLPTYWQVSSGETLARR